jgi:hypothetical protein
MPRPHPNFSIGLGVMIINLLDSIKPKHFNTKILKWDLTNNFFGVSFMKAKVGLILVVYKNVFHLQVEIA